MGLNECAELFSLFSPFDGDCQSGSFVIQRSTRKFDVGVFTQPGSKAEKLKAKQWGFSSEKKRTFADEPDPDGPLRPVR